jgi:hypothetical protein
MRRKDSSDHKAVTHTYHSRRLDNRYLTFNFLMARREQVDTYRQTLVGKRNNFGDRSDATVRRYRNQEWKNDGLASSKDHKAGQERKYPE